MPVESGNSRTVSAWQREPFTCNDCNYDTHLTREKEEEEEEDYQRRRKCVIEAIFFPCNVMYASQRQECLCCLSGDGGGGGGGGDCFTRGRFVVKPREGMAGRRPAGVAHNDAVVPY